MWDNTIRLEKHAKAVQRMTRGSVECDNTNQLAKTVSAAFGIFLIRCLTKYERK